MDVLLIEDNTELAGTIGEYLEPLGYRMDFAYDGPGGLQLAAEGRYDALIMDLGLPGMDGLELCRRLRGEHQSPVPVLILTARDTIDDKLEGFNAGGDDYLIKPFAMQELEIRLQALHRRSQAAAHQRILTLGSLSYNLDTQEVHRDGVAILLQPTPRRILEVLLRNGDRVVTRDTLLNILWEDEPPAADVLRVHVHALRSALDGPFDEPMLHTIRGVGYRLAAVDENNA